MTQLITIGDSKIKIDIKKTICVHCGFFTQNITGKCDRCGHPPAPKKSQKH